MLTQPYLQLPTAETVIVAWFTEWEGTRHEVVYGENLENVAQATTRLMDRMFEDEQSDVFTESGQRAYSAVTARPVWRHEARVSGLTPGQRVPYAVRSHAGDKVVQSRTYRLQALPQPGMPIRVLLASDQQNRKMAAGTFHQAVATVGNLDAVLFVGDMVDTPNRASEWFDRDNERRPAFFPSLQGTFQELFPGHPYRGGEILQNAFLMGSIGNHETPGRFALHARGDNLNSVDNDPQPRWYAQYRFERELAAGNIILPDDPVAAQRFRNDYIRDWSFEHVNYFNIWNHPDDGPAGESYWAYRIGDLFVISLHINRFWRPWGPGRGKFSEATQHLNNPDEWGFGDMFFEHFGVGSQQYEWLKGILASEAFQSAKYRMVMGHQTMFGLGDNAIPVMADPIANITYTDEDGESRTLRLTWPQDAHRFAELIEPLIARQAITDIFYEYPRENDIWRNDIEPLLKEHRVQLALTGHSHLWNRARSGSLHYLETSNIGDSFGAGYSGTGVHIKRSPALPYPGDPRGVVGPNPADFPRTGDPHGRVPIMRTIANPMVLFGELEVEVPFVASRSIGVFTVLDTADGSVRSYAYDWNQPDQPAIEFDVFFLDAD